MTKPRVFPLVFLCIFSGYSPWFYPIVSFFYFPYLCSENNFIIAQKYGKDNRQHNNGEPSAQEAG